MNKQQFMRQYELHAHPLWLFLRKSCQQEELAQDIFQETMARMIGCRLDSLNEKQIRSYIFRIAINLMNDEYRRKKKENGLPRQLEEAVCVPGAEELPLDMDRLFQQLEIKERALLWLSAVEGCSHREIAFTLNLKEPGIRVMLFRVKKKFAAILKEKGYEP